MSQGLTDLRRDARRALERGEEASLRAACRAILDASPEDAEARRLLATHAMRDLRFPEAARWLREVVARRPDDASAWLDLARALCELGRFDEAEAHLDAAAACGVRTATTLVALGAIRARLARPEDARAAYEAAVDADQLHGPAYRALALVGGLATGEPVRARAERLLRGDELPIRDTAQVLYGLAEADLAAGDTARFTARLADANDADAALWGRQKDQAVQRLKRARKEASSTLAARARRAQVDEPVRLIFVLGEQSAGCERVAVEIAREAGAGLLGASPYLAAALREVERRTARSGVEAFERASAEDLQAGADAYFERVRALSPSTSTFVDRVSDASRFAPILAALFPHSALVRVRRDALDEGLAVWRTPSPSGAPRTCDLFSIGRYLHAMRANEEHIGADIGEAWRLAQLEEACQSPRDMARAALVDQPTPAGGRIESPRVFRAAARPDDAETDPGAWRACAVALSPLREGLGLSGARDQDAA